MRERFPVFDLHCDTAVELSLQKKDWAENDLHIDLTRAGRLLTHHQFYAFCCVYDKEGLPLPGPLAEARFYSAVNDFYTQLEQQKERARLCRNVEDLIAAAREDRISSGYMLMHTKGDSAYLAYIPESDEDDGLSITPGEASIGFRFKE